MLDFMKAYRTFTANTESDKRYHIFCALSAIGTILERRVYFDFGHEMLYPNLYVLLVGVPAARKSTALKIARELVRATGYARFCAEKSSREKFLLDLEAGFELMHMSQEVDLAKVLDQPVKMDMRALLDMPVRADSPSKSSSVYMALSEFCDFLGQNNGNFATTLTNLYDNPESYPERLKNSKSVNILRPTINLLGALTPSHFVTHIPPELIGQGFMSRVLLVFGNKGDRLITFPEKKNVELEAELAEHLTKVKALRGLMQFSVGARKAVDEIYHRYIPIPDARFQFYSGRRLTHLIKLCMIVAAMKLRKEITIEDVVEANTYLVGIESFMPDCLGEYGEGKHSKVMQRVLEVLKESVDGVMRVDDVYKAVRQDITNQREMQEVIINLQAACKIQVSTNGSIMLNPQVNIKNVLHVDIDKYFPEAKVVSKFEGMI